MNRKSPAFYSFLPPERFPLKIWIIMIENRKRLGFVGIIIEDRDNSAPSVNKILSQHSELILARTGLPHAREHTAIITLVIDATTDELGLLTGKLGALDGVSVKSGLSKK